MKYETLDAAALRMVHEETGVGRSPAHLEQLGAYGDPARDPRTRVLTVAYWVVAPLISPSFFDLRLAESSAAMYVEFVPVPEIESGRLRLAFDHGRIVAAALLVEEHGIVRRWRCVGRNVYGIICVILVLDGDGDRFSSSEHLPNCCCQDG